MGQPPFGGSETGRLDHRWIGHASDHCGWRILHQGYLRSSDWSRHCVVIWPHRQPLPVPVQVQSKGSRVRPRRRERLRQVQRGLCCGWRWYRPEQELVSVPEVALQLPEARLSVLARSLV